MALFVYDPAILERYPSIVGGVLHERGVEGAPDVDPDKDGRMAPELDTRPLARRCWSRLRTRRRGPRKKKIRKPTYGSATKERIHASVETGGRFSKRIHVARTTT